MKIDLFQQRGTFREEMKNYLFYESAKKSEKFLRRK